MTILIENQDTGIVKLYQTLKSVLSNGLPFSLLPRCSVKFQLFDAGSN